LEPIRKDWAEPEKAFAARFAAPPLSLFKVLKRRRNSANVDKSGRMSTFAAISPGQ
jgi:hypothetical protein